ncbi:MAG TPA: glycoside hydrolase family 18 protein [Ohtaekwangia sp.]|nr:glycoside hydrolase family 18 protein [Ohtaekwangia sp.]
MKSCVLCFLLLLMIVSVSFSQNKDFNIIAYYSRGPEMVDSLPAEKLSHIIFSFCHLQGNKLTVDNKLDSLTISKLVNLKNRNPKLKIILSLGGWGGCKTCSDVFSTKEGITEFSESTLALCRSFGADGLDLDWEYPAIEGYPGHPYKPQDKSNFTTLVKILRKTLGDQYELSFAAGGFQKFLDESTDWAAVMREVDRVNVMSYDLINGYSTVTGHHTALYSTPSQKESTHNAVQYLIGIGVPRDKIVIGAAFYARVWENVPDIKNGLYQSGKFKTGIDFRDFSSRLKGFEFYWDDVAKAPYAYHPKEKLFATFDDRKSIALKTNYVIDNKLDGIMFWEISHDIFNDGLVDVIYNVKTKK